MLSILIAALLLALTSCSGPPSRPGDVLLITVDTLRPDHLGLYGYERPLSPHIDRWFGEGAVFDRSYSTEAVTSPSVVSLLSGMLPQNHRVRLLYQLVPEEIRLLPDLLPEAFETAAFVSNIVLTDEAIGIAGRFDHYDDFVDQAVPKLLAPIYERDARRTTDAVLRWLSEKRDPERPLFLWVHYIDPHFPYAPPPDDARSFSTAPQSRRVPDDPTVLSKIAPEVALERFDQYDAEIAFLDEQVGRLLTGYARSADVERALILLTADHGESMFEHEIWFAHGYHVYDEIVRVPLLIRGPGVVPGRRTGLSSGIDVLPTVLGFAGGSLPSNVRGLDLRDDNVPLERVVFTEATLYGHWRASIQGDQKTMILTARGKNEIVNERFYDLASDPAESSPASEVPKNSGTRALRDLIAADPDPGGLPADSVRGMRLTAPKVDPRVNSEQLEKLRALGYVHD